MTIWCLVNWGRETKPAVDWYQEKWVTFAPQRILTNWALCQIWFETAELPTNSLDEGQTTTEQSLLLIVLLFPSLQENKKWHELFSLRRIQRVMSKGWKKGWRDKPPPEGRSKSQGRVASLVILVWTHRFLSIEGKAAEDLFHMIFPEGKPELWTDKNKKGVEVHWSSGLCFIQISTLWTGDMETYFLSRSRNELSITDKGSFPLSKQIIAHPIETTLRILFLVWLCFLGVIFFTNMLNYCYAFSPFHPLNSMKDEFVSLLHSKQEKQRRQSERVSGGSCRCQEKTTDENSFRISS